MPIEYGAIFKQRYSEKMNVSSIIIVKETFLKACGLLRFQVAPTLSITLNILATIL